MLSPVRLGRSRDHGIGIQDSLGVGKTNELHCSESGFTLEGAELDQILWLRNTNPEVQDLTIPVQTRPMRITVVVAGIEVRAIVDTGCGLSRVSADWVQQNTDILSRYREDGEEKEGEAVTASGDIMRCTGTLMAPVKIQDIQLIFPFKIMEPMSVDMLLGTDFLRWYSVLIDFAECQLKGQGFNVPFQYAVIVDEPKVCTVERVECPPGKLSMVECKVELDPEEATVMFMEPNAGVTRDFDVWVQRGVYNPNDIIRVGVYNDGCAPVVLPKGLRLGDVKIDIAIVESQSSSGSARESIGELEKQINPQLEEIQKQKVRDVLAQFLDVFAMKDGDFGRTKLFPHRIETGDAKAINLRQYRLPHAHIEEVNRQTREMLDMGIISPSVSPWNAPVILVKKKNGTARFCVDYRKLNSVTIKDAYPMPNITVCVDRLKGAKYLSALDLKSGYHQMEIVPEHREKTAFSTPTGHYEFNTVPFGLTNAPANFSRLIEFTMRGLPYEKIFTFLDDILISGTTVNEMLGGLKEVFKRLRAYNLKLNVKKCQFGMTRVKYLGHIVSSDGVRPDPDNVSKVQNYPVPQSSKQVLSFVALASYYRRFIPSFANIAAPLHELLQKNAGKFKWSDEAQLAFQTLKKALVNPPVLFYPDFSIPFHLSTDASNKAIGAVLSQRDNTGKLHPVAYASKALDKTQQKWSATDRELLAAKFGCEHVRPYLLDQPGAKGYTDHRPLLGLLKSKDLLGKQFCLVEYINLFPIDWQYIEGKKNVVADSLSRIPQTEIDNEIYSVFSGIPKTVNWQLLQTEDQELASVIDALKSNSWQDKAAVAIPKQHRDKLVLSNDILVHNPGECIVLPIGIIPIVFHLYHASPMCGGHLSADKTFEKLSKRFWRPNLRQLVTTYVAECPVCQKFKAPSRYLKAPLKPMNIDGLQPMQSLAMDIFGPLPVSTRGNKYCLVIIDYFTKWPEAYPLRNTTAQSVAVALVDFIARYGMFSSKRT